jgi:hypothetical protein
MADHLTRRPTLRLQARLGSPLILTIALLRDFRSFVEEKQFGQWVNLLVENGKSCLLEKKNCLSSTHVW